jgi:O-antigen/teichoic acid export membrane protein
LNKKRLSINLIANLFQFFVGLIISFYFTPFIINSVSKEAYGFFALAGNMIMYITLLGVALNSMAGRFISIEWHKENYQLANEYFNTTLFSNGFLSLILVFAVAVIVAFLEKLIQIPSNLIFDVKILFGLVLLSGIITTALNVFNVATLCTNRLDLKSIVTILTSFVRIGILYCLFVFFKPNILYLGVSAIIVTTIEGLFNLVFLKKLMTKIKISFKYFNKKLIYILVSSGIWNTVNQLNLIMITGLDLLFANIFLNVSDAGVLAIAKTIPTMIFSLIAMAGGVFLPQFMETFAKGDKAKLQKEFDFSFKLSGIFGSIILAGFLVFGQDFYRLWLPKEDNFKLYILSFLTMLQLFSSGATMTQGNIFILTNKLKLPVLVNTFKAILGLIIVFIFIKFTNIGIYAIAGISSIFGILHDLLFDAPYASHCSGFKLRFYYVHKLKFIIITIFLTLVFYGITKIFIVSGWKVLFIDAVLSVIIGILINSYIYLSKYQRQFLLSKLFKGRKL